MEQIQKAKNEGVLKWDKHGNEVKTLRVFCNTPLKKVFQTTLNVIKSEKPAKQERINQKSCNFIKK